MVWCPILDLLWPSYAVYRVRLAEYNMIFKTLVQAIYIYFLKKLNCLSKKHLVGVVLQEIIVVFTSLLSDFSSCGSPKSFILKPIVVLRASAIPTNKTNRKTISIRHCLKTIAHTSREEGIVSLFFASPSSHVFCFGLVMHGMLLYGFELRSCLLLETFFVYF